MAANNSIPPERFTASFWEGFDARTKREGECIVWTRRDGRAYLGYGAAWPDGEWRMPIGAHRLAWMRANGPIPPGLLVLHRCDNPPCVNPDHLFLGTIADNNRDRDEKKRSVYLRGERHHNARLTAEAVKRIRFLCSNGFPQRMIAAAYGVTRAAISGIMTRRLWSHV